MVNLISFYMSFFGTIHGCQYFLNNLASHLDCCLIPRKQHSLAPKYQPNPQPHSSSYCQAEKKKNAAMRSDYSAQDLDAILELATTVQKRYTDVPDQYKGILNE